MAPLRKINDGTRARALWRIVVPWVVIYVVSYGILAALTLPLPTPVWSLAANGTFAVVTLVVVFASTQILDADRSIRDYGLALDRSWGLKLCVGIGIGFVGGSIPYLVGVGAGWFEVVAIFDSGALDFWPGLAVVTLTTLCVGFWEELLYRGVLLTNTVEGLSGAFTPRQALIVGIALSGVLFGAVHTGHPSHPALIATWILAGIVFSLLYLVAESLALPIGAHAGIDLAYQGAVVRTDIAGTEAFAALTRLDPSSSSLLLEYGGVVDVGVYLITLLLALAWIQFSSGSIRSTWIRDVARVDAATDGR